jgi:signal transduction histidine kinase
MQIQSPMMALKLLLYPYKGNKNICTQGGNMELPHSKDKILLVDDDPGSLTLLSNALKQEYTLMVATNGFDALCLAGDNHPDLILLDIMMPGMNGYEVCERLKADTTCKDIPVIFITGMCETRDESIGFIIGAVDYITKPFNLEIVEARIKTHIQLRKMQIDLDTLVKKRTRELEKTNEILREEIQQRRVLERERKLLDAQLWQARKMEAIGYLAAGIAHDFNNILFAILGFAELAMNSADEGRDVKKELNKLMEAGHRAEALTRHILTSCRKTDIQKMPLPIVPMLEETIKFIRATLPSTIRIKQKIQVSESMINADPTQMHQVIMNLCTNAAHAMEEKGGILEISLDELHIRDASDVPCHEAVPGQYYRLVVQDTGHGIPGEIMDKIFDPLFTTKKQGEGTGLGLCMVNGIIKEMNGSILISSEPEKGTRAEVLLPVVLSSKNEGL